ncbi:hypothetical protein ACQWU4_00055 [Chryseobacterium sp. MIQD13]|uniref:hypothetical protein n=1 Tax=Chryseobacterium sp. MIQD13 TaxID=3422310 RepID=UPI003D29D89C
MENTIEIQKEDIKKILSILMDKLDASDDKIILHKDLYWNIPDEELYDVYKDPINLTIGSLEEDWELLQKILKNEREAVGHDFSKISNLFRFIAQYS